MSETTKPSRRAADRARDAALLADLLNPELDLITVASKHFKHHHPLRALARWFAAREHRTVLKTLVAVSELRAALTLVQAGQPAAAALLRLTTPENDAETVRKAGAELLKNAPKRAQPRRPKATPSTTPARSDADQREMDALLDGFQRTNHVETNQNGSAQ